MGEDKIRIDVTLDGPVARKFREIKRDFGVKANGNVVRILIAQSDC